MEPEDFQNPDLKSDMEDIARRLTQETREEFGWPDDIDSIEEDLDSKHEAYKLGMLRGRAKTASNLSSRLAERSAFAFESPQELEQKLQDHYHEHGLFVSEYNPPEEIRIGHSWIELHENPIRDAFESIEKEDPDLEEVLDEVDDLGVSVQKVDEDKYAAGEVTLDHSELEYAPVFILTPQRFGDGWAVNLDFDHHIRSLLSSLENGYYDELPLEH